MWDQKAHTGNAPVLPVNKVPACDFHTHELNRYQKKKYYDDFYRKLITILFIDVKKPHIPKLCQVYSVK